MLWEGRNAMTQWQPAKEGLSASTNGLLAIQWATALLIREARPIP